jgi:hypothetical protein
MVATDRAASLFVDVRLELFGLARIIAGRRELHVSLPQDACTADIAGALAMTCPALLGSVLSGDGSSLLESYTLNINGTAFVSDGRLELVSGDSILLFSSQAGG